MSLLQNSNAVTPSAGYTIDNSLRFNGGTSNSLTRTPGSAGDRQKWTISMWFKRGMIPWNHPRLFSAYEGTDDRVDCYPDGSTDQWYFELNTTSPSASASNVRTTQVFRDPAAWMHYVWAVDTTLATGNDRQKVYINGSLLTAYAYTWGSPIVQNANTAMNNTVPQWIGYSTNYATTHWDGYIAEFYIVDGQQLAASDFGETNEDTNQWQPKKYEGTYGTNGCFLKFDNASDLGEDSSGNGNDWTVSNLTADDMVPDSPTNN